MKRVMITGVGMLCACGNGREAAWANIRAGRSGIGRITRFDPSRCTSQIAGEVKGFQEYALDSGLIDRRAARHMALFTQYAVAAAVEAWRDAAFVAASGQDMRRVAVMVGNGVGGLDVTGESYRILLERGPDRVSPLAVPQLIANEAAGNISIVLGARGPAQVVSTACASSTDALGHALDMIRAGRADVVVAGGTEASITEFCVAGFMKMKALSTHYNEAPETACRPFSKTRDGFVLGEGAAMLVLESEEHARARGAHVYAELAGYGASSDAHHITAPDPLGIGAVEALESALADAGVEDRSLVDYINAHGTSTRLNDQVETKAFKAVFGSEGAKRISISSTKSVHGHLLGGTGALEAAVTALAIHEGFVPPTINYDGPDLDVDEAHGEVPLDLDYTPNVGRSREIRVALSSSLGFGGHNGVLAFRKA